MKIIDINNAIKLCHFTVTEGIYDDSIDATYIIHLLGNVTRTNNILLQLQKIKPTKEIYILLNKGYKYKEDINNSAEDLVDCNLKIFQHANSKNYNNILVLEDDFICLDSNSTKDINKFCNLHKNNEFIFYLGTIPFVFYPYDSKIFKGVVNFMTHSVIYSKKSQYSILNEKIKITDIDTYLGYSIINKYFYYKPLYGQTFPKTENSKTWKIPITNIYYYNTPIYDMIFDFINFFYCDIYPEQFFIFVFCLICHIKMFIALVIVRIIIKCIVKKKLKCFITLLLKIYKDLTLTC